MKKKIIISLALVGFMCLGAGVGAGTMASYKKTFTSEQNTVRAAKFNIDVNKGEFKDSVMTLVGKDLKPGTNKEAYAFEINKDAEVDVEYEIALTQEGELLKPGTPVKIILQKLVNDKWQDVAMGYKYKPESNNEKFKILVIWPEETPGVNDIDYAGKEGKIKITVNANQVIEKESIEMKKEFSSVVIKGTNIVMTYEGAEGTDVTVKAIKEGDFMGFVDQGKVKDGKCEFKTVFDQPGKYVVTMSGSKGKVVFEAFEIK